MVPQVLRLVTKDGLGKFLRGLVDWPGEPKLDVLDRRDSCEEGENGEYSNDESDSETARGFEYTQNSKQSHFAQHKQG